MASYRELLASRDMLPAEQTGVDRMEDYNERRRRMYQAEERERDERYMPPLTSAWTHPDQPIEDLGPGAPEWQGKVMHATNIPATLQKWTQGGVPAKDIRFIAETPEDLAKGQEAGATVEKSVNYKEPEAQGVPVKPTTEDVEGVKRLNGTWAQHVAQTYNGRDPLRLNPIEEGLKKERELEDKWASYLTDPASPVYTKYRKEIDRQRKDVEDNTKSLQERAYKERGEMKDFIGQRMREEASVNLKQNVAPAQAPERVTTRQASEFYNNTLKSLSSYDFTPDQLEWMRDHDTNADMLDVMSKAKFKPDVLKEVNDIMGQAGFGKVVERYIPEAEGRSARIDRRVVPLTGGAGTAPRAVPRVATPAPVAAPAGTTPTKEEALAELRRRGRL